MLSVPVLLVLMAPVEAEDSDVPTPPTGFRLVTYNGAYAAFNGAFVVAESDA